MVISINTYCLLTECYLANPNEAAPSFTVSDFAANRHDPDVLWQVQKILKVKKTFKTVRGEKEYYLAFWVIYIEKIQSGVLFHIKHVKNIKQVEWLPCAGRKSWPREWVPEWNLSNCEERVEELRKLFTEVPKPNNRLHLRRVVYFV